MVKYISTTLRVYLKKKKGQQRAYLMMYMPFFLNFFIKAYIKHYKSVFCGYSFELHRHVDAIQMGTHNICIYKEVDKNCTGCNLKTMELLDCVLIEICAVIRLNTVSTQTP